MSPFQWVVTTIMGLFLLCTLVFVSAVCYYEWMWRKRMKDADRKRNHTHKEGR